MTDIIASGVPVSVHGLSGIPLLSVSTESKYTTDN